MKMRRNLFPETMARPAANNGERSHLSKLSKPISKLIKIIPGGFQWKN